jgi:hypothetical protein
MPMKQIAARLNVSPASVHLWTRDIEISREHRTRNLRLAREKFAVRWIEINRRRRLAYQAEGWARAEWRRPAPSRVHAVLGGRWQGSRPGELRELGSRHGHTLLAFPPIQLHGRSTPAQSATERLPDERALPQEIENWWSEQLCLPRSCFGNHVTDHYPTSSSGRKRNKLPYGVCTLRLYDTRILQHIYGAIQEYGGFEEPRWLDGPPRSRSKP